MNDTLLYFSIVVPAHNEALYIEETLQHMRELKYPEERYEVIVVENGSTDETYTLASRFAGGNVRVLQSEKGVSRAKNLGAKSANPSSDWIVFTDADTTLKPAFLSELDAFLHHTGNTYAVGTTSVRPYPESLKARLWFRFYDVGHIITKASYAISIVRRDLFPQIRFDETLSLAEDLDVIAQARKSGNFFFLWTRSVFSSTRRFEHFGWWYILFKWTFEAMLPKKTQQSLSYEVVR